LRDIYSQNSNEIPENMRLKRFNELGFMDKRIFQEVDLVEKKKYNLSYPTHPSRPTEIPEDLNRSLNEIII
jgi:hypothetical protein